LGKGLEGLGGDREQQAVDEVGVVAGQGDQAVWQGEDDVEVLDRQQLALAGIDPRGTLAATALGAVAVAAGVVADRAVTTVVAFFDVSTEGRGAAFLDVRHRLALLGAQRMIGAVRVPVLPKDVRDLAADRRGLRRKFARDFAAAVGVGVHATGV
jgi:hypothetical protein